MKRRIEFPDILGLLAFFLIMLTLFFIGTRKAHANEKNELPPNLVQAKTFSCTAHDQHVDVEDMKDNKPVIVRDVVSYHADITVEYWDKTPDWTNHLNFNSMKAAGTYCVDWVGRVSDEVKKAQAAAKKAK
jgi:hypothetical protein